jgi:RNA-directed DNA polymerase
MRPIGIPALEDKVVQQAVRMILEPIYEAEFIGFRTGFDRKGRSTTRWMHSLKRSEGKSAGCLMQISKRSSTPSIMDICKGSSSIGSGTHAWFAY